jgi:hypothetical protein
MIDRGRREIGFAMSFAMTPDTIAMSCDVHLFRFGYTWPEELLRIAAHPEWDLGESSEMVFVRAETPDEAERLGQKVAEAFVRASFGEQSYSWRETGFASWIEDDPEVVAWAIEHHVPILESSAQIEATASELARANA